MERKTSRQLQAEATKKRILDTVSEILKEKSYEKMSILEICEKAGISVGAFYHHFENKASLIVELYRDVDAYFTFEVFDRVKDMPAPECIYGFLDEQCRYAIDIGLETTSNVYKAQVDNGNEYFISSRRGISMCLETLLKKAEDDGVLRAGTDTAALTSDLLLLVRGITYNWCLSQGAADMPSRVRRMTETYLGSFMA